MAELGVPRLLVPATAAALAGCPRQRFNRQHLRTGLIDVERDGYRPAVVTASLEHFLGREISASEYLVAEASREPEREYQRRYRREHMDAGNAF